MLQSFHFSRGVRICRTAVGRRLNDLELELELLTSNDAAEVMFPELAQKAEFRPLLVEIDGVLETQRPPQVQQGNVGPHWLQLDVRVEIEHGSLRREGVEGVRIEMVAVSRVGGPVGVGVMRRHQTYPPAVP